jgi:hypothetical protein
MLTAASLVTAKNNNIIQNAYHPMNGKINVVCLVEWNIIRP